MRTLLLLCAIPACAQWIHHPLPNTPRMPDGRPDMTAPAPRTADGKPDLTGMWDPRLNPKIPDGVVIHSGVLPGLDLQSWRPGAAPIPMTPWAGSIFEERVRNFSRGIPSQYCLPHGIPDAMMIDNFKIVQHPGLTLILHEEFARFRQIFTDGRSHPAEMNPAWLGYSIGTWDGDTFVVDTRGFNERSWLDFAGHPHSDQLRTIERFRRIDFGHMQLELTFDDPIAYREPWSATLNFELMPDTELIENVCDNEKDHEHIVGRVPSDDHVGVSLSLETLREYAGLYQFPTRPGGEPQSTTVTLIDGHLVMNGMEMTPTSESGFSSSVGTVTFFRDANGRVEKLLFVVLGEGQLELHRKQ